MTETRIFDHIKQEYDSIKKKSGTILPLNILILK